MTTLALLFTALLFGGMVLYSFAFAAFLFTALPAETAGQTLRRAFPHFYLFVIVTAAASAICLAAIDPLSAAIMAAIAATTLPTRQILMPAINTATDAGNTGRFGLLHGVSVAITLGHIAAAAFVLHRFAG